MLTNSLAQSSPRVGGGADLGGGAEGVYVVYVSVLAPETLQNQCCSICTSIDFEKKEWSVDLRFAI